MGDFVMVEFKREERFIVVKRKAMHSEHEMELRVFLAERNIGTVECVVVESDWPEYETVWQMIEARSNHRPVTTAAGDGLEAARVVSIQTGHGIEAPCVVSDSGILSAHEQESDALLFANGWNAARAAITATRPTALAGELVEAFEQAHALIQEAKGVADGPDGGYVTDHLDFAEHWLDKAERLAALRPASDAGEVERVALEALVRIANARNIHFAGDAQVVAQNTLTAIAALKEPKP
jgi:hypothetical protein